MKAAESGMARKRPSFRSSVEDVSVRRGMSIEEIATMVHELEARQAWLLYPDG